MFGISDMKNEVFSAQLQETVRVLCYKAGRVKISYMVCWTRLRLIFTYILDHVISQTDPPEQGPV